MPGTMGSRAAAGQAARVLDRVFVGPPHPISRVRAIRVSEASTEAQVRVSLMLIFMV